MRAQVGKSRRKVVDDIDMFRMQSSNEEEESKQGTTLAAQSKESSHYTINYEYRSRDEVANAILKLRGKEKQAEYVNRAQAQHAKPQNTSWVLSKEARDAAVFGGAVTQSHSSRTGSSVARSFISMSDVKSSEEARDAAVFGGAVTQSHSSRTGSSVARSFVSMRDVKSSKEAREPAVIADDANSSRTGPLLQQEYIAKISKDNMPVARSFVTTNLASGAATVVEPGEQVVSDNVQRHSLHIEPKTKSAYIGNRSKKTKKKDGILKSLFRCGMCATETQLPDFSVLEEVKEYSVDEGLATHVEGLKIETSSQFLSPPPPPSAYIHVAPCDVVHHSESIGGCSTITHSVAGKLVVRDEPEEIHSFPGKLAIRDEPEVIRDNATTTKHSNMSSSASSLMDRNTKANDHVDVVSKIPSVQDPSNEQMSDAEYMSLGLGSKGTYTQHYSASKSDSLSFMSVVGKGSSMGQSSASELGSRTQSQSFSLSLRDQDSNTFSSASATEGASEEDSDYTLTDGSSSAPSSIDDSFLQSSYASTMPEYDSMTYGTSLSGSSSGSYEESRYD